MSGHRKKSTERGALTPSGRQRKEHVRTRKETDRARRTHKLETAEGGTCQDPERDRPSEVHSRPGDSRGRNLSGDRKKPTKRGALTVWKRQRKGLVRTRKETDQAMRTHILETAEGVTRQDTERNRPSNAHSHPGDGRGSDSSGHGKKPTEQCVLTPWRRQRE